MSNEADTQESRGAAWMRDNPRCARCGTTTTLTGQKAASHRHTPRRYCDACWLIVRQEQPQRMTAARMEKRKEKTA